MATRTKIAMLWTEADAELARSVRLVLDGLSREQIGEFGIEEFHCARPEALPDIFRRARPDLTILIEPADTSFFAKVVSIGAKNSCPRCPFLLVLPESLETEAAQLLKAGASDYVLPPIRPGDLIPRVLHLLRPHESEVAIIAHLKHIVGTKQIVGQSPLLLLQLRKLPLIAGCDATVLITGETGTGKELCARAIHYLSRRSDKPFVAVDCGAIPADLIENELFGHERGAYTSAPTAQPGLLQESEGGTLFLDEIDTLSIPMQSRLLRLLQEKEYRPLGSPKSRHADVRVIAASNVSLEEAVRAGSFRQDLYYRLNILSLIMPPLRDRREDIPLLAQHFLDNYAAEFSCPARNLTEEAVLQLLNYPWPGNARELENLIERAVLSANGPLIDIGDVELPFVESSDVRLLYQARKNAMVRNWECEELKKMLVLYHGNISAIAKAEGKDASAFRALLRKLHLRANRTSPYWSVRM